MSGTLGFATHCSRSWLARDAGGGEESRAEAGSRFLKAGDVNERSPRLSRGSSAVPLPRQRLKQQILPNSSHKPGGKGISTGSVALAEKNPEVLLEFGQGVSSEGMTGRG